MGTLLSALQMFIHCVKRLDTFSDFLVASGPRAVPVLRLLSTFRLRWTSPEFLEDIPGLMTIWNCRRASSSLGWMWTSWKQHMKSEEDNCFSLLFPVATPYPHPSDHSHVQNKRAAMRPILFVGHLLWSDTQINKHRITSFYLLCWCSVFF